MDFERTLAEKAAYIRGMMDGLELDAKSKEVKVLNAMMELIEDLAGSVEELEEGLEDLYDAVDEIDEDLGEVEEALYSEGGCGCGRHHDFDDFDDFDFPEFQVTCPNCGEVVLLEDADFEEDSIHCPKCGALLEFDFDDIEDEDDE